MRYLTLSEVFFLHDRLLAASGGAEGMRDLGVIEAALAQPKAIFGGGPCLSVTADGAPRRS